MRLQGWSSDGACSIFSLVLYPVLAGGFFAFSSCFESESDTGNVRDVTEDAINTIGSNIIDIFRADGSSLSSAVYLK